MAITAKKTRFQTTTVRLPLGLYEEARSLIESDDSGSRSFNDFMVASLIDKLKQVRRERIDAEFSAMRHYSAYARESQLLAGEFETNDRQTLRPTKKARR